ncbi:hypothetical protein HDV00_012088 [Rhizophlyctis rosea]|nr:hypothetical protein HDV00_012088 [Rhizophlyctis rosea]
MSNNKIDPMDAGASSYLDETKPLTSQPARVKQMNLQPSYANTIPLSKSDHGFYEGMINGLGKCLGTIGSIPLLCCFPNPFKTVTQGEVGLITYFGRYYRSVDPGLYEVNVLSENISRVNIKLQIQDIPQQVRANIWTHTEESTDNVPNTQHIMTKDNVNVKIDSVLYWHIVDPYVDKHDRAGNILGVERGGCIGGADANNIHEIQAIIDHAAEAWGVRVESILIKDLGFTQELQETLSAAAKQKRVGESKVIAAQAEVEAAKLMREASDILNTPAAMQIRYLETLTAMSRANGTKVIFMPPASASLSGDHKGKGPAMTVQDAIQWENTGDTH